MLAIIILQKSNKHLTMLPKGRAFKKKKGVGNADNFYQRFTEQSSLFHHNKNVSIFKVSWHVYFYCLFVCFLLSFTCQP